MQDTAVQQTVRDLLNGVQDPKRAAALIAAVVAHHAPELQAWAEAMLRARHPRVRFPAPRQTPTQPSEGQYFALFGIRPQITPPSPTKPTGGAVDANTTALRLDPELGRLCVALHRASELRLWVVLRQQVREAGGNGWVERRKLPAALQAQDVRLGDRHLRRLLARGEGLFWNATRERVYLRSWAHVAAKLTEAALAAHVGQAERNRAGARELYVAVGGSLVDWEARLYAAWFAHRNNPTISRSQLSSLFHRDATVLRGWEQTRLGGQLTVRHNYAQCPNHETFLPHIPAHATSYVAWVRGSGTQQPVVRIRWQLPNSYLAGAFRQHHRKGQVSKVRRRVNTVTGFMPAEERRGGWHRLYFDQPETLRRFVRTHPEVEGRYIWRGENHYRHGIFEINTSGFPLTQALERARPRDERRYLLEAGMNG